MAQYMTPETVYYRPDALADGRRRRTKLCSHPIIISDTCSQIRIISTMARSWSLLSALLLLCLACLSSAFTAPSPRRSVDIISASTVTAPPPPKTANPETETSKRGTRRRSAEEIDDVTVYREGPLEYLEDEWESREPEDPFHILLLSATFDKKRITQSYVAGSISYVLGMPEDEADELTAAAAENGMSCLGTWEREECLKLGRQLQIRDIVVRVVPFAEGGQRGWQAKNANDGVGAGAGAGWGSDGRGAFD